MNIKPTDLIIKVASWMANGLYFFIGGFFILDAFTAFMAGKNDVGAAKTLAASYACIAAFQMLTTAETRKENMALHDENRRLADRQELVMDEAYKMFTLLQRLSPQELRKNGLTINHFTPPTRQIP